MVALTLSSDWWPDFHPSKELALRVGKPAQRPCSAERDPGGERNSGKEASAPAAQLSKAFLRLCPGPLLENSVLPPAWQRVKYGGISLHLGEDRRREQARPCQDVEGIQPWALRSCKARIRKLTPRHSREGGRKTGVSDNWLIHP